MIKLNGVELFRDKFPNGEACVEITNYVGGKPVLEVRFESDADLMHLYMVRKELEEYINMDGVELLIPYFPYSRMDRREDYLFTLKHVCNFINDLKFSKVTLMEAHSDVTTALLDRVVNIKGTEILLAKGLAHGYIDPVDCICFPDASAAKRYHGICEVPTVSFEKHRDFTTGKLTSMSMHGNLEAARHVVIVDDLCSAGGTFQWAASILKLAGVVKVTLVVAHCEPTVLNGLSLETNQLDHIETTNSIIQHSDVSGHPSVYIYNTEDII
jgi:ribose-phosphate pyrophosphokinase